MDTNRTAWQPSKRGARHSFAKDAAPGSPAARSLLILQRKYRAALSGAVVAKARYLAQVGEGFATAIAVERAHWRWQRIDGYRARLAAEISKLTKAASPDRTLFPEQCELRI